MTDSDIARGVLAQSRIRVADKLDDALLVYVDIQCTDVTVDDLGAFSVDVHFGRFGEDGLVLSASTTYGETGHARTDEIRESVRDMTEVAITDCLKADFDL